MKRFGIVAGAMAFLLPSVPSSASTGPEPLIRVLIVDGFSNHDWQRNAVTIPDPSRIQFLDTHTKT